MRYTIHLALGIVLLAFSPQTAHAHLVATQFGNFYSGMLHPVTTLSHLLPWVALGMLTGLQEKTSGRWMLIAFPFGVMLGTSFAWILPSYTQVSILTLASLVVLGALVALAWRLPMLIILGLGSIWGITHGYENGLALHATNPSPLYVSGVTTSSYIIIALITALTIVTLRHGSWGKVVVRSVGSWITAIGVLVLSVT